MVKGSRAMGNGEPRVQTLPQCRAQHPNETTLPTATNNMTITERTWVDRGGGGGGGRWVATQVPPGPSDGTARETAERQFKLPAGRTAPTHRDVTTAHVIQQPTDTARNRSLACA
jgi:hypothetical protein